MAGFIKIYRDVLDTVLFSKPVLLQMWLLLSKLARFVKTEQDGIEILPGQVLTSVAELAQRCNLPERRVRYVLDCLEKMDLIRRENIRNRYTLITLTNPDELRSVKQVNLSESGGTQKKDTQPQLKREQQTDARIQTKSVQETDTQSQTKSVQKSCFGLCGNVYLTVEEKQLLQKRSPVADSYIEKLSAYKRRTNKMYEDDFAVLCEWISKDEISKNEKQPPAVPKPRSKTVQENTPIPSLSRHPGFNTDFFTAPASYDLERAEHIARTTVPTLRKRKQ